MKKNQKDLSLWDNLTTFHFVVILCHWNAAGKLPHHFLHQTDQFHEPSPQLCHFFIHFCDMLLVDLCQWFKSVSSMLFKEKKGKEEEKEVVNNRASFFHFIPLLLNS